MILNCESYPAGYNWIFFLLSLYNIVVWGRLDRGCVFDSVCVKAYVWGAGRLAWGWWLCALFDLVVWCCFCIFVVVVMFCFGEGIFILIVCFLIVFLCFCNDIFVVVLFW